MVTMRDVAKRAGVSIATVSFVLNDTKPVTPATRQRIEQAMTELGFRRNVVARALASRRTRIIAMAYPALDHRFGFSAAEFFTSAADAARKQDYHLVLWPVGNDGGELTELVGQCTGRRGRADGGPAGRSPDRGGATNRYAVRADRPDHRRWKACPTSTSTSTPPSRTRSGTCTGWGTGAWC